MAHADAAVLLDVTECGARNRSRSWGLGDEDLHVPVPAAHVALEIDDNLISRADRESRRRDQRT